MNAQQLLQEISDYCRSTGLAELTFGRRAVNDGKLASRLRNGGRITTDTLDRIHGFMAAHPPPGAASHRDRATPRDAAPQPDSPARAAVTAPTQARPTRNAISASSTTGRNICCSSTPAARKWEVAQPRLRGACASSTRARRRCACSTPASATARVLTRVMRAMHDRFSHMPFYVVGKEISLEDVRLTLQKMADRFFEHPGDGAGAHQSRLRGRAVAGGEIAECRLQPGLARAAARRQFGAPFRAADHRSRAVPGAELESWRQRAHRQSGLRASGGARRLSRGPPLPARSDHSQAGRHARQLRSGHRLAALSRARLARVQGAARDRRRSRARSVPAAG